MLRKRLYDLLSKVFPVRKKSRPAKQRPVQVTAPQQLEERVVLTTIAWDGGGADDNWTTAANWVGDVAPNVGDDLVFSAGAARLTNNNDFTDGTTFGSITFDDSGYTLTGNRISLDGDIVTSASTYYSTIAFDIDLLANHTVDVGLGTGLWLNGAISGTGFGLTKLGDGYLVLSGAISNTYTGTTVVNAGSLNLAKAPGSTAVAGGLTIGNGSDPASVQLGVGDQIADSSTVTIDGEFAQFLLSGYTETISTLNMTGGEVDTGIGTLTLGGDINSNSAATTAYIIGNIDLGGANRVIFVTDNPSLGVDLSISANISGTGAGIAKGGVDGTLLLTGNNSYDGVTTVADGILLVGSSTALGDISSGTVVDDGATLALQGNIAFAAEEITLNGSGVSGLGALYNSAGDNALSSVIILAANSTIGVESGTSLMIAGQITDTAGSLSLTKAGTGYLSLTNANPFDGGTIINAGIVGVSNSGAFGTGAVQLNDSASLEITNGITLDNGITVTGLAYPGNSKIAIGSGSNVLQGDLTLAGGNNESIETASGSTLTLSGDLIGSRDLDKNGTGTLIISGTTSHTGTLNVLDGTLLVNGDASNSNHVFVDGVLGGTGSVSDVYISGIGTLAPGNSPGGISTGNLNFTSGGSYSVELNGATGGTEYDQTYVTGTVDLGDATLNLSLGYIPTVGTTFTIIDNDGADPVTGTFAGLAEGATFTSGNTTFSISYAGGTGNDVVLTAVSVTFIWDGGGSDSNWTTAANWVGDVAPQAGADLVFADGAARITNTNDFASGTPFNSVTIAGAGYNILGNRISLTDGFFGTLTSGNSNFSPNITLLADATFDVASGGRLSFGSTIGGSYSLTKSGAGEIVLFTFSNNTFSGNFNANEGTVYLNAQGGAIAIPNDLIIGDNATTATVVLAGSGQINNTSTVTVNEGSTFDVNGRQSALASLILQGATVQTGSGGLLVVNSSITSLVTGNDITSTIQGAGTLSFGGNTVVLNVADDGDISTELRISATITNGGLSKAGAGTLALSGSNSYDGSTAVNSGLLQVESDTALGTPLGATVVANGAGVTFSGPALAVAENFTIEGTGAGTGALYTAAGDTTLSGSVLLSNDATLGSSAAALLTINGVIDDGASSYDLTITSDPTGTVVLGGMNTFDGTIDVVEGYLRATANDALGNAASLRAVTIEDGASLELSGGITIPVNKLFFLELNGANGGVDSKIRNLAGTNTINGIVEFQGNEQFYAATGTTLVFNGTISQSGGTRDFVTAGAGTIVTNNFDAHSGDTYVIAGTLLVNGTSTAANSTQVFSGATLGGTGTVSSLIVNIGATLAPGNSPGILNAGDTTFNAGSSFNVEINGATVGTQYDRLNVTGTVSLAIPTLNISLGYLPAAGTSFVIINNDGSDPVTGTFAGLSEGATLTVGVQPFQISYVGGTGNDVVLTALTRTDTWTGGGGDSLWTTGANWLGGLAPNPGDQLVFPPGASRLTSINDFAASTSFDSIVIAGAGYDLSGNAILLENGISTSYVGGTTNIHLDVSLSEDQIFDLGLGTTLYVDGVLSGSGVLLKGGSGILTLAGTNTYDGGTVHNQGTILVTNGSGLGTGLVQLNDGELDLSGDITVDNDFHTNSPVSVIYNASGANTLTGDIEFNSSTYVDIVTGSSLLLSGTISGSSPVSSLSKNGAGSLLITGTNTYAGATLINEGLLQVFNTQSLGTTGMVFVQSGATLRQSASTFTLPTGGMFLVGNYFVASSSNYTLNGLINLLGSATFTIGSSGSLNVTGVVIGMSSLTLSNSSTGTLILSNTNGYTGATVVAGGNLQVDGSIATSSSVTVSGGTLKGTGILPSLIAMGGTVAPGNSPGILQTGNVNFGNTSALAVELNGATVGTQYDQLAVTGTVLLNSPTLNISMGFAPAPGTAFTIISNDGSDAVSGSFAGLPEGAGVDVDGVNMIITYAGGDGNDVVLRVNSRPTMVMFPNTSVDENLPIGTDLGAFTTIDPDGPGTFTYSLVPGLGSTDNAAFSIDSNGHLITEAVLDYETKSIYSFRVRSTDSGGLYVDWVISLSIVPLNDNAPVFTSSTTFNVAENTTAVGTVAATDADLPSQTVTYSITGGADAALFNIDPSTGALTFLTAPDFENPLDSNSNNVYRVNVTADDNAGLTTVQCIAVTVTPVNDNAPVFTSPATFSLYENFTNVSNVTATDADEPCQFIYFSITGGVDQALFDINPSTGALRFLSAPDYENPSDHGANNTYVVKVTAYDGYGLSTEQCITVTVLPINETSPVFNSPTAYMVAENNTSVGTVSATDNDLPALAITYSITGGADEALFTVDPSTGELSFLSAPDYDNPLDFDADNVYEVQVTADDNDGATTAQNISVTVTLQNDNAPVFTTPAAFSVAENTTVVGTVNATDADVPVQTVTYSITGGVDAAKFSINSATGELTFVTAPDYETPTDQGSNNVYVVKVTASDGVSLTTEQCIIVTVTPVNDNAPVFTSSATFSVAENSTAVGTVTATDADLPAQTLTYSISGGADAALFSINASTGELTFLIAPDYEIPTDSNLDNVYDVEITADDSLGSSEIQAISVTVTPVNDNAPVFTTSATFSVAENTTAVGTVNATDADLPGQTLTYSITGGVDASRFSINSATGELTFVSAPDYEDPADDGSNNVYVVKVTANDGGGQTTVQCISVTVTPLNDNAPVFASSTTFTVAENSTTVGTVNATDADLPGQTVTYSITGGADASRFSINPATGELTFLAAQDYEDPTDSDFDNIYEVEVTANDNSGLTTTQSISVTVSPFNDNAPIIASTADFSLAENTTAVGTVLAIDLDLPGQTITYSITGGVDAALFTIDPSTGALSFLTAPDFEHPTDSDTDGIYELQVTADDNAGLTTSQSLVVTVTPANDNAPVFTSPTSFTIAENSTTIGTVAATDADLPVQELSFSISGGADGAKFSIDPTTGALIFLIAPDFDAPTDSNADNVYDVEVTVSDNNGLTTTQTIAVTVTGLNDNAPVFVSTSSFSIPENLTVIGVVQAIDADLPTQTVIYSITGGADAARFTINPTTGLLTFVLAPNYESPADSNADNVYDIEVMASDNNGQTTFQSITVTVAPANEFAPVITSSATFSVVENTTAVGTVQATDADLPGQTLTYSITGGADASLFTINAATGALAFLSAPDFEVPTDSDTDGVYEVVVTAFDNAGLTSSQSISVTVTDINDLAPVFTSPTSFNVEENSTSVGVVTATDADLPGQTVTYSITGGADAALFSINPETGALSFLTAPDFEVPVDSDTDNVYEIVVTANDGLGLTSTQSIAITVTGLNDNAPVITSPATFSLTENGTTVGTVTSTDADLPAQTVTYSITGGVDAALFTIDPNTGELSFVTAPDFEIPTDDGADGVYNIQVTANDNAGLTSVQSIAITVTAANDNAPAFSSSAAFSVAENATAVGTIHATDADAPAQTVTYSITGGPDAALFHIDVNTGVLTFLTAPDYESPGDEGGDNIYDIVVTAADGHGSTTTQNITVTVTAVNDNSPAFLSAADFTLDENLTAVGTVIASDADQPGQTLSYSITGGVDAALFTINPSTGALAFLTAQDFEHPTDVGANNTYQVQVTVSDGQGLVTVQDITVTIANVVEDPSITLNPNPGTYDFSKTDAFVDSTAQYQPDVAETNYSSAVLTVSITANRGAKDVLKISSKGTGAGEISVKGKKVYFGGVLIGTFEGGSKSTPNLVVRFNSSASEAAVQALLRRITFQTKKSSSHATRTVQMQITNVSGHNSNPATRQIELTSI